MIELYINIQITLASCFRLRILQVQVRSLLHLSSFHLHSAALASSAYIARENDSYITYSWLSLYGIPESSYSFRVYRHNTVYNMQTRVSLTEGGHNLAISTVFRDGDTTSFGRPRGCCLLLKGY